MERLTFAPDGVGAVARRNERADAPPMLTRKYRVDVTSAERAMVGAESPERARGVVDDAIEDDGDDGNGVSESVYSLFEVHRGESSIDESPPEDVGERGSRRRVSRRLRAGAARRRKRGLHLARATRYY